MRNRYFNFGHSDYFLTNKRPDDTFMRRHWVPLLTTDGETELVDMRETSALTGIKLTLLNNAEPIKIAVCGMQRRAARAGAEGAIAVGARRRAVAVSGTNAVMRAGTLA